MLADIGFYLLLLCCFTSAYGLLASLGAAFWRHRRLYRSSRLATTITAVMALTAAIFLWYLLFQRDYSVAYIFRNSSNDLPRFYTVTAFWSSLEGSHFLWTLLLSIYACVALWTANKDNEHIMPYVAASLQAVLTWMFYLLISHSDPFVRMFPSHSNGLGMNTLLQNPYMAIHPPTLFNGYTALAIPAAYSVAALCYGDITEGWLKTTRRWTLWAWCFLTAGIVLGGHWAYVELGWAGYWAWDPVENSSFIPWLFATALLHSLVIQDKLGHLKRLTLVLAFLAFFFCFFGTFITRSGIISSVHSFAESPIGPNYLMFLAVMLLIVVVLYGFKAHSILPSETDKIWGVSKESALIVTQFLLLTFAVIVCVGTLYPIVSEALTKERTTVQAPYFNAFAPWIGLGLIVAIAVGNIMRYQVATIPNGKRTLGLSAILALPLTGFFVYMGDVMQTVKPFALGAQLVGMYLASWSFFCLTLDLVDRCRDLRFNWKLFLTRNRAYFGGYVAHVGLLIAIVGFLGNYRGLMKVATLKEGESASLYGYEFRFDGMRVREEGNATLFEAILPVSRGGVQTEVMHPARSKYPTKDELHHEIALHSMFWHDLYVTLADFDKTTGKTVTLEIHINPTVRLVWIAAVIMVLGGLIALSDKFRGNRSRDALRAAAAVFLVVACSSGFGSRSAFAQMPLPEGSLPQAPVFDEPPAAGEPAASVAPLVPDEFNQEGALKDEFRDVAGDLRCPTCTGLSVLESDAKFSVQIKDIVKEKVKAGESKEQILKYFTERYGPWILRAPPATGFNLLAWLLPIALLLLGPPMVWLLVWRKRRVVSTFGVRSTELIVREMEERLAAARRRI